MTLDEISSHPWLEGRGVWKPGEADYKPHPRLGGDLSLVETEVLARLEELGISEETLRGEMMLGVRSPVIATYRWGSTEEYQINSEIFSEYCSIKLLKTGEKVSVLLNLPQVSKVKSSMLWMMT